MARQRKYGFDLTEFKSVDHFKKVLKENKLSSKPKKVCFPTESGEWCQFEFQRKGLKLVTGSNPITGISGLYPSRERQKGYASYMGLEGTDASVKKLAKSIRKNTEWIKGSNPKEREFI